MATVQISSEKFFQKIPQNQTKTNQTPNNWKKHLVGSWREWKDKIIIAAELHSTK